jgi:DNA-binding NarL/FixJ family response regulator
MYDADEILGRWMEDFDAVGTHRLINDLERAPSVEEWEIDRVVLDGDYRVNGSWNLSRRQREVLQLFADGYSEEEIYPLLGIRRTAVKEHAQRARIRLRCRTTRQAVAVALCSGLIKGVERHGEPGTIRVSKMTPRGRQVLRGIADGLENHEIAESLGTSTETVKSQVAHILHVMGARNRAHAVRLGFTTGIISVQKHPQRDSP